jgi:hypothetical protein
MRVEIVFAAQVLLGEIYFTKQQEHGLPPEGASSDRPFQQSAASFPSPLAG